MRRSSSYIPREVFVEPAAIGTTGAYVAPGASRVYTRERRFKLPRGKGRIQSGSCGVKSEEVNGNGVSMVVKELSLQVNKSNAAAYCVMKIVNTRLHVEFDKHVKLGTAETILQCVPTLTWFDARKPEAGEASAGCVNSIRGNNYTELAAVRTELERKLAYLVAEEKQIINEYLDLFCNDNDGVIACTTRA